MEVDWIVSQIFEMSPVTLFLVVIGFGIAKLPQFVLQRDKAALESRDSLIRMLQEQIQDLKAEIRVLKRQDGGNCRGGDKP